MRVQDQSVGLPTYMQVATYSGGNPDSSLSTHKGIALRSDPLNGKTIDSLSGLSKDNPILRPESTLDTLDNFITLIRAEVNFCMRKFNIHTWKQLERSARHFLESLDRLREFERDAMSRPGVIAQIENIQAILNKAKEGQSGHSQAKPPEHPNKTPQAKVNGGLRTKKPKNQGSHDKVEGSPRTENPKILRSHNKGKRNSEIQQSETKSPCTSVDGSPRTDKPDTQRAVCTPPILRKGGPRTRKPEIRETTGITSSEGTGGPRTKRPRTQELDQYDEDRPLKRPRTQELVQYDEDRPLKVKISLKGLQDDSELNLKISSVRGASNSFAPEPELHTTPTRGPRVVGRRKLQPAPADALPNDDEVEYLETVTAEDLDSFFEFQEDSAFMMSPGRLIIDEDYDDISIVDELDVNLKSPLTFTNTI